jgi:protein TonB
VNTLRDDAAKSATALLLSIALHAGLLVALSILGVIPAPTPSSEPFPLYLGPLGPAGGAGAANGLGAPAPAGGTDGSIHIRETVSAPRPPAPDTPKPDANPIRAKREEVDAVTKAKPKPPTPIARPAVLQPSATAERSVPREAAEGSGGAATEGVGVARGAPGGTGLGGGGAGGTAAYEQVLAAWLDRHKYYPSTLRRRGIEGEGKLQIRITRKGDVLDVKILKAFTHPSLTSIAEDWVKRAEPFPPVPSQISGESYVFAVPVVFRLE